MAVLTLESFNAFHEVVQDQVVNIIIAFTVIHVIYNLVGQINKKKINLRGKEMKYDTEVYFYILNNSRIWAS